MFKSIYACSPYYAKSIHVAARDRTFYHMPRDVAIGMVQGQIQGAGGVMPPKQ